MQNIQGVPELQQRQKVMIPLFQQGLDLQNFQKYSQNQAFNDEEPILNARQPQDFISDNKQQFGNMQ